MVVLEQGCKYSPKIAYFLSGLGPHGHWPGHQLTWPRHQKLRKSRDYVATHPVSNLLTELFVSSNNRPFKHRAFNIK